MSPGAITIGIVVPHGYSGGTMRAALNSAIQIHDGAHRAGDRVRVEFGYVDVGQARVHAGFKELERRNIVYRPIRLEMHDPAIFAPFSNAPNPGTSYVVFNDGVSNFDNAQFVLIVSDRILNGIPAPTYRYGMVVYDYIQRYVPAIFDGPDEPTSANNWRITTLMLKNYECAEAIFVTTDQARSDAIAYGGVPSRKVVKLPMEFDPIAEARGYARRSYANKGVPYIVWTTNSTQHKNHLRVLQALEKIYSSDKNFPDVLVTGQLTHLFDVEQDDDPAINIPYIKKVRTIIERSTNLKDRLIIVGNIPDNDFIEVLSGAEMLLHSSLFDNGTYSVVEAAWFGVPSVSSRYAPMEEIARNFRIPLIFFDPQDSNDMARALRQGYQKKRLLKTALPSRESLGAHSRDAHAIEYWKKISSVIHAKEIS